MKTQKNLMSAFAGESQANRKYLAFAKKAKEEGKNGLAKLFRVAAEGETIHALIHLENAGSVKDSIENLKDAIAGETHEFTVMYPEFMEDAKNENQTSAKIGFFRANAIEKTHEKLFSEALEKGGDIEDKDYYICSVCGHPEAENSPEKCPVCGAPKEKFYKID